MTQPRWIIVATAGTAVTLALVVASSALAQVPAAGTVKRTTPNISTTQQQQPQAAQALESLLGQTDTIADLNARIQKLEEQQAAPSASNTTPAIVPADDQNDLLATLPQWLQRWWQWGLIWGFLWWIPWFVFSWQWWRRRFWVFVWPWPWWWWLPWVWFIPWLIWGWWWGFCWWFWWCWLWWWLPWIFWLPWWLIVIKHVLQWLPTKSSR